MIYCLRLRLVHILYCTLHRRPTGLDTKHTFLLDTAVFIFLFSLFYIFIALLKSPITKRTINARLGILRTVFLLGILRAVFFRLRSPKSYYRQNQYHVTLKLLQRLSILHHGAEYTLWSYGTSHYENKPIQIY